MPPRQWAYCGSQSIKGRVGTVSPASLEGGAPWRSCDYRNATLGASSNGETVLKLAILGTRGIPGNYGGFETFAEELATRLVMRGHSVTVYCRKGNSEGNQREFHGVELVHLPAVRHRAAETLSHTLLSVLHAATRDFDIVYVCNSANAPLCVIPRLRGQLAVLNVDGLEWRRAKWGTLAKRYYRWAARLAARMPIHVVTDAAVIQAYYRSNLGRETDCFPYGTDLYERGYLAPVLDRFGLKPDGYVLYVSRLERENNALLSVEAFRQVRTGLPLVIVGDAPYAGDYIAEVRAAADERVRFLGYQFGDAYHALQANARVYIQATEVGGTHPALVEAMGHRNAVLAHDVPEHHEVLSNAGWYFARRDAGDLAAQLQRLLDNPAQVEELRGRVEQRVSDYYTWEAVTESYEQYFDRLLDGAADSRRPRTRA